MPTPVSTSDVLGFRLSAHHLSTRLSADGLLEAAGRCGVQNSPPGSALLALGARVEGLTVADWDRAVGAERSLLQTWCMRGAPYVFPTSALSTFTTGALPVSEAARRHLVVGVEPGLQTLGIGLDAAVALTRAEIEPVLTGRRLTVTELGAELAPRIAEKLGRSQRPLWSAPGPYAAGQSLGEGVVHFCLRLLCLQQVVCFAPRSGKRAPFVLLREWLGDLPDVDPATARAELLRRYLRCYGPATPPGLAGWLGVLPADAGAWWREVEGELTEVDHDGPAWVLTDDLDALRSSPRPEGLRLLPPHDPFTQLHDRETIADRSVHRLVWRSVGAPGVVLSDGTVIGTWRARKVRSSTVLSVTAFRALTSRQTTQLQAESELVARLRGTPSLRLEFSGRPGGGCR